MKSLARPATQERIKKLMAQGFHQPGDVENLDSLACEPQSKASRVPQEQDDKEEEETVKKAEQFGNNNSIVGQWSSRVAGTFALRADFLARGSQALHERNNSLRGFRLGEYLSKNQFANYLPALRLAGWHQTQGFKTLRVKAERLASISPLFHYRVPNENFVLVELCF